MQELLDMCEATEVRLEYLPPYSPDFIPIEEAFAEMKAWIKRNYTLADSFDTVEGFFEVALEYMSKKVGNHFLSCRILM